MDFNEINKVNLNNISPTKREKKKPAKESPQQQKENLKQTPNNPTYWQSAIGVKNSAVSFSGNSQSNDEFVEKQITKIKNVCYWGNDEKTKEDFHRQSIQKLLPKGEEVVNSYVELAGYGIRDFWRVDALENYNNSLVKLFSEVHNIGQIETEKLSPILYHIVNYLKEKEEIDKYTSILCELLNNQSDNTDYKIDWMEKIISHEYRANNPKIQEPEEVVSDFETYINLCSFINDDESAKNILNSKLEVQDYETLINLFEDENIPTERFAKFIKDNITNDYWNNNSEERLMSIVKDITNDEKKKNVFAKLIDGKTSCMKAPSVLVAALLEKDLDFMSDTLDYFQERKKDKKLIPTFVSISDFFNIVDSSNFEDFEKFSKGSELEEALLSMRQYKNPKTGLFDINIAEKQKELEKLGISEYETLNIAKACIDMETGELSKIADEVIDVFYPQKEQGLKGKIKTLKNKFKCSTPVRLSFWGYQELPDLLNALKDKDGKFDKENQKFLYGILRANKKNNRFYHVELSSLCEIINGVKNEDGKIDKVKAYNAINMIRKTNKYRLVEDIIKSIKDFPNEKQADVYQACVDICPDENIALSNFSAVIQYCFDKDGNMKEFNYEFAKKLINKNPIIFDSIFFEACEKYPQLLDFYEKVAINASSASSLRQIVTLTEDFMGQDGTIKEEIKKNIIDYITITNDLSKFSELHDACYQPIDDNGIVDFDQELFNKALKLIEYERKLNPRFFTGYLDGSKSVDLLKHQLSLSEIKFKEKVSLLNSLKLINDYTMQVAPNEFECINKAISDIEASLSVEDIGLPIDKESKINFIRNVLASKNSKTELTEFEKVITNSIPKLEEMTDGLTLTYPREKFLKNLSKICNDDEKLNVLSRKVGISPIIEPDEDGNKIITGYNGLIKLNELDRNNPFEDQLYDCLHEFMYENSVNTGDKDLDKQLNFIVKAFPEFINTIGKKQHGTQKYTVDVHSLLVLAYSINNPDYMQKLSALDKSLLKISAIFHDLMKQENIVDKGHQNLSSLYTRSIVKKVLKNKEIQNRIFELIDNHHWTEEYSCATDQNKKSQELAFRFRKPNDFEIAQIIARSDLKAVNENFYERLKSCLDSNNINPIQKNLDYIYSTGNAIFTDKIKSSADLSNCIQTKNGIEYKVINLHSLSDDADVSEFGFGTGKKKEDLKFLVHMVDSHSIYNSLNTIKLLTSPLNGGVLSESLISPKYNRTYCNRKHGVLLSEINTNIVNASKSNQSSGKQKDFSNIIELIFGNCWFNDRKYFKNELLKNLGIPSSVITDKEYAEFYKNVLALKNSLLEINESKTYKIGEYSFTGKQLREAINKYQDELIDKQEKCHNEIVGYTPQINAVIAKEPNLDSVPNELLKFAHENNLPIILL